MSMERGIALIINEKRFIVRSTLLYTLVISIILLFPLSLHLRHEMKLHDIHTEIELKAIQLLILAKMDAFGDNPNSVFEFPTYIDYFFALYDAKFATIYTQFTTPLPAYRNGYFAQGDERYLITAIPSGKYFGADYLVTKAHISYSEVYKEIAIIAFGIVTLILGLSFLFLQNFSRPFKRVNAQLDNFIQESIHEINTPLSIMMVNINLFEQHFGSSKYLRRIKSATQSLSTIYDDMDYLIKRNRLEYPNEPIDFTELLYERIEHFSHISELKSIEILPTITEGISLSFNSTKLKRLIDNTISNAIKYSHKSSTIEVELTHSGDGGVMLVVRDYGVGMKSPKQLTQKYYLSSFTTLWLPSILNTSDRQITIK